MGDRMTRLKSRNMKYINCLLIMAATTVAACSSKPEEPATVKESLPEWQEGYMDIHHISTGRGDAILVIMPDGTSWLQDAGDCGTSWYSTGQGCALLPNSTRSAGEWIAEYVRHFTAGTPSAGELDYAWLTHFHGDHIGDPETALKGDRGYRLTGITMVGDMVKIHRLVDRAYPGYDIPTETLCRREFPLYNEYRLFTDWQMKNNGMEMEGFEVGSDDQFRMVHNPSAYGNFSVRNLCGNGYVWTGEGTSSEKMYSADPSTLDENMYSCGVVIQYGKFRYWNCGDIPGTNWKDYSSQERTFETPVSKVCGPVTVMKLDHHGTFDSTSEECLKNLQPKEMIAISSHVLQPYTESVRRMMDTSIYPGERGLYVTTDCSRDKLGDLFSAFKPAGHIVVRVYGNGDSYQMYVLDAKTGTYDVIYKSGIKTL